MLDFIFLAVAAQADSFPTCYTPFGKEVPALSASFSPHTAMTSRRADGQVAIVVNDDLIRKFSPAMRQVVFLHECGHIALAHLSLGAITPDQEQEADCFGVRAALTLGRIGFQEVSKVQAEFTALGAGDHAHLNGAARSVNLGKCTGDRSTWESCKKRYDENLQAIEKAIPTVEQMGRVCKKFGAKTSECTEAKDLTNKLNSGFLKAIVDLDRECPQIVDPRFSKVIHDFQEARQRLAP